MRDDAVLRRALPLGRGLGRVSQERSCIQSELGYTQLTNESDD